MLGQTLTYAGWPTQTGQWWFLPTWETF